MPTAPYDPVEAVLQASRVRLNDAIQDIGGDVLKDTAGFTQTVVNAAYRRLQEYLVELGWARLKNEVIFASVPASTNTDLGSQVYLAFTGYYDGTTLQTSPALPQDMISPLLLWERTHGTNGVYTPIDQLTNGLPTIPKDILNRTWEWREEQIYLPGASGTTDIRLRYAAYLPDFIDNSPIAATPWYQQKVPIMRAYNALAWGICSEMAKSRGDVDAGYFDQMAQQAAQAMFERDAAQPKTLFKQAEAGKMPDKYTPDDQRVKGKQQN